MTKDNVAFRVSMVRRATKETMAKKETVDPLEIGDQVGLRDLLVKKDPRVPKDLKDPAEKLERWVRLVIRENRVFKVFPVIQEHRVKRVIKAQLESQEYLDQRETGYE